MLLNKRSKSCLWYKCYKIYHELIKFNVALSCIYFIWYRIIFFYHKNYIKAWHLMSAQFLLLELTQSKTFLSWNYRAFLSPIWLVVKLGNFKTRQFFGLVELFLYCLRSRLKVFSVLFSILHGAVFRVRCRMIIWKCIIARDRIGH